MGGICGQELLEVNFENSGIFTVAKIDFVNFSDGPVTPQPAAFGSQIFTQSSSAFIDIMSKRDAVEAFGEDATAPPLSKKRARRKVKHSGSKPRVDGLETTSPGPETPSKASQAGNAKSEQLKTDSTLQLQNAPGNKNGGSKGPRRKKKGNRGESRPENSQSAGPSLAVTKTEAIPKHQTQTIRKGKNRKVVDKSKTAKWKQNSKPPSEVGWDRAIQGGFFIDQDPLMSKDEQ